MPFSDLITILNRVHDIENAANLLEWDHETYMPAGAAEARSHQVATLRQLAHEQFTSQRVGDLLADAEEKLNGTDPLDTDAALVRVSRREYDKATKVPSHIVAEMARTVSRAKHAWKEARENDAFSEFAPHLQTLIALSVEKAEALGYEDRVYDALLDQYEPGMKTADVERVFGDLRARLVPLVDSFLEAPQPDGSFLHKHYDHQKQWDFGLEVIRDFGYDFNRGRQDLSAHPFTTSFSITDVRLTTRVNETFLPTALFGTLHEAGHGLYEQGVALELDRTLLAEGTSLGMHESQSRLWENLVGRSLGFWKHYYPRLQQFFPDRLGVVSLDNFYRAINRVSPSLIRVEADEVTYNLHIMLRFELETALIDRSLSISDLPAAWNDKMEEYLGIRPKDDAEGVLQDIHWSLGIFGYFPTYALGNLMSTQLFDQAEKDLGNLEAQIEAGQFTDLLNWLREKIHQYGKKLDATDLLKRTTGSDLNSRSWLAYIERKYGELYG